ncbi:DUF309 domain-containing protein [Alkalihalobacillus sp. LMS39]|uniref:DUF309 domain-containing protein n=1 Tax=Alkalihalobacillus sp. LMS39 TaxID=2924032 RepID=UPI001FB268C6|nr:DUF309 domain-containing protein [Alkalihalobacillus sp. LMS39]UOE93644.1 DUF309 domain-containing protein [Alkalihalobacillus sp. LMS39]
MSDLIYPIEYYEFFIKFNEGDYYTCHDLLEEIWMTEKDNYFLKGLLQMTVAIYHYEYGNVRGARLMMQAAHQYIQSYRPKFWGVDLEEINDFIKTCLSIIPQDVERVPFEDVEQLPKLPSLALYLHEEKES